MTPPTQAKGSTSPSPEPTSTSPKKQNPVFKALGLPSFRAKLPSRNWLIFIGIVSAWTGLIAYDRREKKRIREEWCLRVSHLAEQPLPPLSLPRKITVYLSAPPGDGITAAREYFKEYVKPVLVAAAVDYDVVEGRRAGEVRADVSNQIRKWRKRHGGKVERSEDSEETLYEEEDEVEKIRQRVGVTRETPDENSGILVVGRHTWKEFIRGIHEGWLGPPKAPPPPPKHPPSEESEQHDPPKPRPLPTREKPRIPSPTINPEGYPSASLPPSLPHNSNSLPLSSPTAIIPFPHLLGFLNTPFRIYRYLNQRHLMARTCRETAALCLGFNRPFYALTLETPLPDPAASRLSLSTRTTTITPINASVLDAADEKVNSGDLGGGGEIDSGIFPEEENDWPKKYRNSPPAVTKEGVDEWEEVETEEDTKENDNVRLRRAHREWRGKIAVDGRVAGRMRRYDVPVWDENVDESVEKESL